MSFESQLLVYGGFVGFVILMLALDLGVFHRKAHVISVKEALAWSALWIALGLSFSIFVYYGYENHWLGLGLEGDPVDAAIKFSGEEEKLEPLSGANAATKYLLGYILEKALSVDNIFVIAMIFTFFGVPQLYQHRVLFWGILGALLMRGTMIGLGAVLVAQFEWILYLFGVLLVYTAYKMLFFDSEEADPSTNFFVRLTRRFFPVTDRYHGEYFFLRAGSDRVNVAALPGQKAEVDRAVEKAKIGTLMLTPLALALVIVETTDLIFAVDSIPAVFAVTADPFLVFTSNVFAILGLRSLFFALGGMLDKFRYLKAALAIVLAFIGVKMLAKHWIEKIIHDDMTRNFILLGVVMGILVLGVVISLIADAREHGKEGKKEDEESKSLEQTH